jgi:hypothetical protein
LVVRRAAPENMMRQYVDDANNDVYTVDPTTEWYCRRSLLRQVDLCEAVEVDDARRIVVLYFKEHSRKFALSKESVRVKGYLVE